MNPTVFARLIQELDLNIDDTILSIGSGTGYGVVILSYLVNTVIGIESDIKLFENSSETLFKLNVDNAAIIRGSIVDGFVQQAPYSSIIIEGGVDFVPSKIIDQLSEGGKLVTIKYIKDGFGKAVLYEKIKKIVSERILFDAYVPLLSSFQSKKNSDFKF